MNKPWECPRCNKINAPWNPACFCKPENKTEWPTQPVMPSQISMSIVRCSICNGQHLEGVSCINLKDIPKDKYQHPV